MYVYGMLLDNKFSSKLVNRLQELSIKMEYNKKYEKLFDDCYTIVVTRKGIIAYRKIDDWVHFTPNHVYPCIDSVLIHVEEGSSESNHLVKHLMRSFVVSTTFNDNSDVTSNLRTNGVKPMPNNQQTLPSADGQHSPDYESSNSRRIDPNAPPTLGYGFGGYEYCKYKDKQQPEYIDSSVIFMDAGIIITYSGTRYKESEEPTNVFMVHLSNGSQLIVDTLHIGDTLDAYVTKI